MTDYSQAPYIAHPNDETAVIFIYQTLNGHFDLDRYIPEMTNHQLQTNDLQQFFHKIELYLQPWRESIKRFSMLIVVLCLISVVGSISVPLILVMTKNTKIILYIMTPMILGLSFRVLWMSFKPALEAKVKLEAAKQKIVTYIASHEEFFRSKGLRWSLPRQFPEWIELWKEYQCPDGDENSSSRVQIVELV